MNGLPEGWILTSLGEIGQWGSGGTPSRKNHEYFGSGIPWIKSGDLPDGPILRTEEQITELGLKNSSAKLMPAGTISIAMYGATIGKLGSLTFPAATNQACANVIPQSQLIDRDYLFFYLLSEKQALIDKGQGGAQPNISQEVIKAHPIVIAPLAEQRRIVAKLKPLLGKVDAYQQRLAKIPAILKRFRQAVLTAACSGRLTVDWRTSEPQAESDRELILKIHRQREEICKAVSKTKGLNSTVSSSASRMQPSPGPEYEVPASWQFASMDELTCLITSGSRDWKKYYSDDGPGTFIMAQNVRPLKYDRSYRLGVNPPANDKDRTRSEVRQNDLLVTIVGANTGDVCRILEPIENHYVCQSVALMRPVLPETSAFIELFLNSISHGQDQYRHMIYGGGRPHLSFDNLRETVIALPPLAEQQEIVSRVETFFKLADQIEARYQRAKPLVDKLPQSILAKAFRGELVPTEAEIARREGRDYEPASVLLERIRSERTEHAQGRKGKAKSQPKPTKGKVSGVAISKS